MSSTGASPPADAGNPSRRRAIAVILAGSAGFIDAAGFLALDLFTAHMSGNSARLGVYLGGGLFVRAAPSAFAIGLFFVGIGIGTAVIELLARSGHRSPAAAVLATEVLLLLSLAAAGSAVETHGTIPSGAAEFYPLAALAVLAMGLQTSTLQRISGKTVRTTFVSGMLTNLADEIVVQLLGSPDRGASGDTSYLGDELGMRPGRSAMSRIRLLVAIWLAYVAGAVLGGYLERRIDLACMAIPAAAIVGAIAADLAFAGRPLADAPVTDGPGRKERTRPTGRANYDRPVSPDPPS